MREGLRPSLYTSSPPSLFLAPVNAADLSELLRERRERVALRSSARTHHPHVAKKKAAEDVWARDGKERNEEARAPARSRARRTPRTALHRSRSGTCRRGAPASSCEKSELRRAPRETGFRGVISGGSRHDEDEEDEGYDGR